MPAPPVSRLPVRQEHRHHAPRLGARNGGWRCLNDTGRMPKAAPASCIMICVAMALAPGARTRPVAYEECAQASSAARVRTDSTVETSTVAPDPSVPTA